MPYTADNRFEVPDPVPVEKPLGWKAPETLESMIRRIVQTQVSQAAQESGHESFDEANDFEDDYDFEAPESPFQSMKEDLPPGYLPDASESPQSPPKAPEVSSKLPSPESPRTA